MRDASILSMDFVPVDSPFSKSSIWIVCYEIGSYGVDNNITDKGAQLFQELIRKDALPLLYIFAIYGIFNSILITVRKQFLWFLPNLLLEYGQKEDDLVPPLPQQR